MAQTPAYLCKTTMHQGISFRHLLLLLHLAQLPAIIQGNKLVLGKAGDSAELLCQASQKRSFSFTWKDSNQNKILGSQNGHLFVGNIELRDHYDSRRPQWDQGSFPLIIRNLKIKDSGTYTCEVENKKETVELQVFKVTASPGNRLLQGQSLTLTLESPSRANPSMQCSSPRNRIVRNGKVFSVHKLEIRDTGTWICTVTQAQHQLVFNIDITVLGLQKTSETIYKKEGEPVEFSFPLNLRDETLHGSLSWRIGKEPSQTWLSFSLENRKVAVKNSTNDPKLQLAEELPLHLKLLKAQPRYAGSGNLTLNFGVKGSLYQEVNLVVMKVSVSENTLSCQVFGPTSPSLTLSLRLENQKARVSKQEKAVQVLAPEAGTWQCLLSEGDQIMVDSQIQVSPTGFSHNQPMFLAVVLGSTLGSVVCIGLCVLCCVQCRNQRHQAARTSQIKKLLSEKKTCQCPHRLQKTQNLI